MFSRTRILPWANLRNLDSAKASWIKGGGTLNQHSGNKNTAAWRLNIASMPPPPCKSSASCPTLLDKDVVKTCRSEDWIKDGNWFNSQASILYAAARISTHQRDGTLGSTKRRMNRADHVGAQLSDLKDVADEHKYCVPLIAQTCTHSVFLLFVSPCLVPSLCGVLRTWAACKASQMSHQANYHDKLSQID